MFDPRILLLAVREKTAGVPKGLRALHDLDMAGEYAGRMPRVQMIEHFKGRDTAKELAQLKSKGLSSAGTEAQGAIDHANYLRKLRERHAGT